MLPGPAGKDFCGRASRDAGAADESGSAGGGRTGQRCAAPQRGRSAQTAAPRHRDRRGGRGRLRGEQHHGHQDVSLTARPRAPERREGLHEVERLMHISRATGAGSHDCPWLPFPLPASVRRHGLPGGLSWPASRGFRASSAPLASRAPSFLGALPRPLDLSSTLPAPSHFGLNSKQPRFPDLVQPRILSRLRATRILNFVRS